MEGFAVLRACALAGVPAVEVRVVSNEIGEPDRDLWRFDEAFAALDELLPRLVAVASARVSRDQLPPPLPPETRTVGQLVAESVRLYGDNFWPSLAARRQPSSRSTRRASAAATLVQALVLAARRAADGRVVRWAQPRSSAR